MYACTHCSVTSEYFWRLGELFRPFATYSQCEKDFVRERCGIRTLALSAGVESIACSHCRVYKHGYGSTLICPRQPHSRASQDAPNVHARTGPSHWVEVGGLRRGLGARVSQSLPRCPGRVGARVGSTFGFTPPIRPSAAGAGAARSYRGESGLGCRITPNCGCRSIPRDHSRGFDSNSGSPPGSRPAQPPHEAAASSHTSRGKPSALLGRFPVPRSGSVRHESKRSYFPRGATDLKRSPALPTAVEFPSCAGSVQGAAGELSGWSESNGLTPSKIETISRSCLRTKKLKWSMAMPFSSWSKTEG